MTAIRAIGSLCAALALIQLPVAASADELETAVSELEDCVLQNLDAERSKKNPDVERLLRSCNAAYQRMRSRLPPGGDEDVFHFVKHQIQKELKKK